MFPCLMRAEHELSQGNEGLFIRSLMRARDGDTRDALSNDDLLAQIKTFLIAGSETTSTVLTWTLKQLATTPQLVQNIRDEVAELLKRTDGQWPQTMEDLQSLSWSEATFREAIRLHSPVNGNHSTCVRPTTAHVVACHRRRLCYSLLRSHRLSFRTALGCTQKICLS